MRQSLQDSKADAVVVIVCYCFVVVVLLLLLVVVVVVCCCCCCSCYCLLLLFSVMLLIVSCCGCLLLVACCWCHGCLLFVVGYNNSYNNSSHDCFFFTQATTIMTNGCLTHDQKTNKQETVGCYGIIVFVIVVIDILVTGDCEKKRPFTKIITWPGGPPEPPEAVLGCDMESFPGFGKNVLN